MAVLQPALLSVIVHECEDGWNSEVTQLNKFMFITLIANCKTGKMSVSNDVPVKQQEIQCASLKSVVRGVKLPLYPRGDKALKLLFNPKKKILQ